MKLQPFQDKFIATIHNLGQERGLDIFKGKGEARIIRQAAMHILYNEYELSAQEVADIFGVSSNTVMSEQRHVKPKTSQGLIKDVMASIAISEVYGPEGKLISFR